MAAEDNPADDHQPTREEMDEYDAWVATQVHQDQPRKQDVIADLILGELMARHWSPDELGRRAGQPAAVVLKLLAGSQKMTHDLAQSLADAFGTSKDLWVSLYCNRLVREPRPNKPFLDMVVYECMQARAWSYDDLASRSGLSADVLLDLMRGEREFTDAIAGKLAYAFGGRPADWLNMAREERELNQAYKAAHPGDPHCPDCHGTGVVRGTEPQTFVCVCMASRVPQL